MKKKLITFTILAIIAVIFFYSWHHKSTSKIAPKFVTVQLGDITEQAEAIGYIKPRHSMIVKSQINGTIAEIYHDEGDLVKKGEVLLKVNPTPSPENYAEVYQSVISSRAKEQTTANDLRRYRNALKANIITSNNVDYVAAQRSHSLAKEELMLAEQKLSLLDKGSAKVGDKSIANIVVSPINGFIITKMVDVGDAVISLSSAQASTALFALADMNDIMFRGSVDEMDAAKIKTGMPTNITIGSMPDTPIVGTLSKIALQSDKENSSKNISSSTSTTNSPFNVGFQVEITDLKWPPGTVIRSGYSAIAKIKIQTAKNVLILPARLIHYKDEKPFVFMTPKDGEEKPLEQPVKIGMSDGMNVEIKEGLKAGDQVLDIPEAKDNE
ncbi:MAG: efflux RND transporter periplasmic adaptor subunit [Gammaproteobacteria bacterium]